jgi:DNA repair photolyase
MPKPDDEFMNLLKQIFLQPMIDEIKQNMLAQIHENARQEAQRSREQGLSIEQICERRFPNWHELSEEDRQAIIRSLKDTVEKEHPE